MSAATDSANPTPRNARAIAILRVQPMTTALLAVELGVTLEEAKNTVSSLRTKKQIVQANRTPRLRGEGILGGPKFAIVWKVRT